MLQKIHRGEVLNNTTLGGSLQKAFERPEVRSFPGVPDDLYWSNSMIAAMALKSLMLESGIPSECVKLAAICGVTEENLTPMSATCTMEYAGNTYCLDAFGVSSVSEAMLRADMLGPPAGEVCVVWEGDDAWAMSVGNSSLAQVRVDAISAVKEALEVFLNFRIVDFSSGFRLKATSATGPSRVTM